MDYILHNNDPKVFLHYRYKPGEETLLQVDKFCVNLIAECDASLKQKSLPVLSAPAGASPLPVSSFASAALVKSLHYVRSLVALHIPRRSFQPAAFAGATLASRQLLPSLSSLLSKSFNSQLSPANAAESPQKKDAANLSVSNLSNIQEINAMEDTEYISSDLLNWRWVGELQLSSASSERYIVHDFGSYKCSNASLLPFLTVHSCTFVNKHSFNTYLKQFLHCMAIVLDYR